jgi:class 3 adenylate cyclase
MAKQDSTKAEENPVGIKSFLDNPNALTGKPGTSDSSSRSRPIAELFPATTIMMADVVGFTAWSSVREPAQVFMLLEGIFSAFDQ